MQFAANCGYSNSIGRATVAIEPGLRTQSPENGNIREVGRRLSAIGRTKAVKWGAGDRRQVRESPPLAAFSGAPIEGTTYGGLRGWGGRDRTLQ
jgi:hypothetical protein